MNIFEFFSMDTNAYFTRDEVVIHNTQADIWVIVNRLVFDLTKLIEGRVETMNDVSFFSEV